MSLFISLFQHDKFDLVKVGEWEHLLNAQRLSLEILTNLCSGADGKSLLTFFKV